MKLIKAKTTRRFGGEPYITLPRGAKVESGTSPEPKELTPDEVASYVASLYEKEPTDIVVSELPVINNETPPTEGTQDTFYKMSYSVWVKGMINKEGAPTPNTAALIYWRAPDNGWGCNFRFFPVCILNDDFDMLVKVYDASYTD